MKIEPGASYLIESDSGIDNPYGGAVAVINAGTIAKTGGSGTSQLYIDGSLSNTGTVEVDSGTLFVNPTSSLAQLSGTTLTGGTWKVMNGSKLNVPSGVSITSNAATMVLDGAGATVAAISGLASNSGSFTLSNGANLSTTGASANSGDVDCRSRQHAGRQR